MTHLIAAIWQGLAIVAVVDVLLRGGRRLTAATRHVIWWSALAAVLGVTLVHAIRATGDGSAAASVATSVAPLESGLAGPLVLPAAPGWLATVLAATWICSMLWHGRRFVLALGSMKTIRRRARPLSPAVAAALPCWSRLDRHEQRASLVLSTEAAGASALGLSRRPLIVLPEAMPHALEPQALDQIVMHERAHLLRRDDWTRALQWLVTASMGLHPAVRLINRRIDVEREIACDDDVVRMTGSAGSYAACLARAAELTARGAGWSPSLMPGATDRGTLLVRVRRLLDPSTPRGGGVQMAAVVAGTTVLLAASVVGAGLSPLIVVTSRVVSVTAGAPSPSGSAKARATSTSLVALRAPDVSAAIESTDAASRLTRPAALRRRGAPDDGARGAAALRSQAPATAPPASITAGTTSADIPVMPARVPLASRAFVSEFRLEPRSTSSPRESGAGAWAEPGAALAERVTSFGAATAQASRQTGRSVAGFFSRSGKALAERF